ncbi:MAG: hypothetical protein HOB18_03145 [Nitrospina sp.]|jgi:hypothetical protein|nr:hypothetical protein [Nitrospina sp.]
MLLRKNYIYVVVSALLLALLFFGVKTLHHEWRAAYTILFQKTYYKVNLIDLQLKNVFEGIVRPLLASREKGLPERRLYISQKSQNLLMQDLPANTKKWQRAFLVYPDGKLRRVKARQRGDNPVNWAFHRKSWRVKLQKNRLIDRTRVFDYVVPQEDEMNDYFPYFVGHLVGVLAPKVSLVELFLNDESQGIYHEMEHIDENFLRGNKLMPVNIYKGEQLNKERQITISRNLFDNPRLWTKVSVFNQLPETDFSDFEHVLELIRRAETSHSSLTRLKRVARYADWARFSAFQTLVQSWHNSIIANMRLVSDPWKGSIRPVIHDTTSLRPILYSHENTFDIVLDSGYPQPLLSLYQNCSDFLVEKYRMLYRFVKEDPILKAAQYFEEIFPAVERSFSRNNYRFEKVYINQALAEPVNLKYSLTAVTTNDGMKADWQRRVRVLRWFQGALQKKLSGIPTARWLSQDGLIGLIVRGAVPLDRVTLELSQSTQIPKYIKWDADGDGRLSSKDVSIPFRVKKNQIELDAVWVANRVVSTRKPTLEIPITSLLGGGELTSVPTQFQLIADVDLSLVAVRAANFLTGEMFLLNSGGEPGNTPSRWNVPVVKKKLDSVEVWAEDRVIEGAQLIDRPVRILPGITLRMRTGASLIFRNRIDVQGTMEAPVKITSDLPNETWGTIALHGRDTTGSVLSHLVIENGSGAFEENVRYIGMLSVHEARNVEFRNLTLRKNRKFDDMMHIVYSEDIRLLGCVFQKAFSDGLDVDISTVRIQGCRISGSGNDAIDLMDSKVLIMASELSHSGDKGVSVGEGSKALIYNSNLHHNVNGVESKDGSVAYVVNSDLIKNDRQINAYKKNWHYGSGGRVIIDKSIFSSVDNSIKGDKKSDIGIFDSTFSTGFGKKDQQVLIDSLSDDSGERKAASADYQMIIAKALQDWGIKGNADRRGMLR